MKGRLMMGSIGAVLFFAVPAAAEDKGPSTVLCIGGAGEWGVSDGGQSFGPEIGLEHTIIEHYLEIEVAVSPLFSKGPTEFDTEFLLKKPFDLTDRLEFLVGAGPVWIHKTGVDSVAGEALVEFVYSP